MSKKCQGPDCQFGRRAIPITEDRVSIDLTGLCRRHYHQMLDGQPLTRVCDRCMRSAPVPGTHYCDACQARQLVPWGVTL